MFRARAMAAICSVGLISGVVSAVGAGSATAEPVGATQAAATVLTARTDTAPRCGGVRPPKPGGGHYTCTFTDDFNGTELDTTKWTPTRSSDFGFVTGLGVNSPDCYLDRPENVAVKDGRLHLTSRVEAEPFTCKTPYGDLTTSDSAGGVQSAGKFAQAYGRFEFRAKFPSHRMPDFDSALWLSPENQAYGKWPHSGEIDVAEWFGDGWGTNPVFPSVHYAGEDPAESTGRNCFMPNAGTQFRTYAVNWTPTKMSFYYNNQLCFEHAWTPDPPLTGAQPFDQAFHLVMTQTGGYQRPVGTTVTTEIDWVRAWK